MTSKSVQTWLDRLTQPLLQVQAIVWHGHKDSPTGQDAALSKGRSDTPSSLLHCPATRSSKTALGALRARSVRALVNPVPVHQSAIRMGAPVLNQTPNGNAPVRSSTPLYVVQIRDDALLGKAGQRQNAGRMVISGRMADVCAQLERMAA